jgi:hypothetical protein
LTKPLILLASPAGLERHLLIKHARETAAVCEPEKANPRTRFQFQVLEIYVSLGGKLRISRNSNSQKVQGPLAKYFFAVVRPVMGESTPSPESLPGIVDRQKRIMGEAPQSSDGARWFGTKAAYNRRQGIGPASRGPSCSRAALYCDRHQRINPVSRRKHRVACKIIARAPWRGGWGARRADRRARDAADSDPSSRL